LNEELKAVALKYEKTRDRAPKVVAKGKKKLAEKIIELAKENNIEIYEDPDLVEMLYGLDFNEEIPEELYGAVAEILAYVYKMSKNKRF
jgi:flagellar biosynthesis protein